MGPGWLMMGVELMLTDRLPWAIAQGPSVTAWFNTIEPVRELITTLAAGMDAVNGISSISAMKAMRALESVGDLSRLDGLLSHAMENLMERFTRASADLSEAASANPMALESARIAIGSAVMELQFQDMASQLIGHTSKILQGCAYRLAAESMGAEEGEAIPFVDVVPDRPNPVTQGEMDAGSVELF